MGEQSSDPVPCRCKDLTRVVRRSDPAHPRQHPGDIPVHGGCRQVEDHRRDRPGRVVPDPREGAQHANIFGNASRVLPDDHARRGVQEPRATVVTQPVPRREHLIDGGPGECLEAREAFEERGKPLGDARCLGLLEHDLADERRVGLPRRGSPGQGACRVPEPLDEGSGESGVDGPGARHFGVQSTNRMFLTRFQNLLSRLATYSVPEVVFELLVIWGVVYVVVRFVQGTRAAGALKGALVVILVGTLAARILGGGEAFLRLGYLYDRALGVVAVCMVVIFQPELRRAMIRLGEVPFFRTTPTEIKVVVDAIVEACVYLARSRFGALIVIERRVGLRGLVEGGTPLGAEVTAPLLQTIFFPGTALHDLAVVVRGRIVDSAGVQLPMAEPSEMTDPRFGARHRAAVGVTRESDALVVVVSEESGQIRIAEHGKLSAALDRRALEDELIRRLRREPPASSERTAADEHADTVLLDAPAERKEGAQA